MPTTVGQHAVATFTSPINGTSPIDANSVRSNDNTLRQSYVTHDADPGIHVQSSTLASRPLPGVAGRKWITEDSNVYTLWFDNGSTWLPVGTENIEIAVQAKAVLAKGDVVKIVGWNNGLDMPEVDKVSSASDIAFGVMAEAASLNAVGYLINTGFLNNVNTSMFSIGDILYPNTSGWLTASKPTSGSYQVVAYVLRSNSTNGAIFVEFSAPRIVEASANTASTVVRRDGSGNFSAGTITASLNGNATTATSATTAGALSPGAAINGTTFTGASPITITAANPNALTAGTYLTSAGTYDGAVARTFAVDATDANTANKVVARDASGNFAAGTITASLSGNASTATALQTARTINGVSFDGTANVTVTADANTLTGSTLASGVTASSLTSVGTLGSVAVSGATTLNGVAYTWPSADGTTGQILSTNGSGTLAWSTGGGGGSGTVNTGVQGYFAYYPSNGTTVDDQSVLFTDNTNLGVGTASPAHKIDVAGNANLTTGSAYKINGTDVLTATTLGSGVTSSSLTSVGTLANLTVTNPITGSVTGNAATATALQTARTINGTSFDGTANITVAADANTLTGSTLASGVTASSLTSVGTLSALTMGGTVSMADNVISRPRFTDYAETLTSPSISSNTLTLNLENGNVFTVSLNANITTLTIQNPPASGNAGSFTLRFTADGTGRTVTWGASVKWPGGTAPTLTSTNNKVDTFVFFTTDAGTNWYAFVAGQNA